MTGLDRIRLGDMTRAGARAVSKYTGTVFAVYLVQLIAAASVGLVAFQLLAGAFAERPMFDEAVDGDLIALLTVLRDAPQVFSAIAAVVFGAVVVWSAWSWFLTGGVLAVFTEQPQGRRDTARCFGAGGAATYFVFARLAFLSFALQLPALFALTLGVGYLSGRIADAVELRELYLPLVLGLGPALLLHVTAATVTDYARAELALRRPTHEGLGALRVTIRAIGYLARRPLAIGHALLGWAAFALVLVILVWLTHDTPMYGGGGAVALFAFRQLAALVRTTIKLGVLAGQVELTATRPPPPRTIVRPARP